MKIKLIMTVFVTVILIGGLKWATGVAFADTPCDSAYVMQLGNVTTVKPTGVYDTDNLQCAFDAAVAYGTGAEVQLSEGDFHTSQIVVNGFKGVFTGAGMEKTTITNLPNLPVTPVDFYLNPPSVDNPWPALFAFTGGNFLISDLTIHISGDNATTGWSIYGINPPITELALAIGILGSEADARVEHISLEGEVMQDSQTGYSVINGIYFEGFLGELPWSPLSGSFQVYDSIFKKVGYATPVFNVSNAAVKVSHNYYEDIIVAMDVSDTHNTTVEFSHNQVVNAWLGFDVWDFFAPEHVGSTFLVKNNLIQGMIGIVFEQTFGAGNECLILGNNVENVTDLGIYLGLGTTGCTVVGGNNKANVVDEGTDNVLTGINNMSLGIGPDISLFMRKRP